MFIEPKGTLGVSAKAIWSDHCYFSTEVLNITESNSKNIRKHSNITYIKWDFDMSNSNFLQ